MSAVSPEPWGPLAEAFATRYRRAPEVLVQAPGRVNLIGEHTDYNGLPVLPMAIDRHVTVVAAARADRRVHLASCETGYPSRCYDLQPELRRFAAGDWGNYHQAAAHGLRDALGADAPCGADFLVSGTVPPGAGLASSSALVVGSMLAWLAASGHSIPRLRLAELAARAERYVGTQSGGMDQAVCLLAQAGSALRIDFDPLRVNSIAMHSDAVAVVVCDSLVAAEKSGAARAAYNRRVLECRLACRVLEHLLGDTAQPSAHLGELQERHTDRDARDLIALLEGNLPPRPLTVDAIAASTGAPPARLAMAIEGTGPEATFAPVKRARHVLSEAARVGRAAAALTASDWVLFGALMNASHASCRDDYEISTEEIEALIASAKAGGALGARLTGAGFGGCTINLVHGADVDRFQRHMERQFYRGRTAASGREHCFVVRPSGGAVVRTRA
jgi:galactokinase